MVMPLHQGFRAGILIDSNDGVSLAWVMAL